MKREELINMKKEELLKKKEELEQEYIKEYDEMERNQKRGTTSDVLEFFSGILHLIERNIDAIEEQLKEQI